MSSGKMCETVSHGRLLLVLLALLLELSGAPSELMAQGLQSHVYERAEAHFIFMNYMQGIQSA